jgi:hypothetical protein
MAFHAAEVPVRDAEGAARPSSTTAARSARAYSVSKMCAPSSASPARDAHLRG